MIGRLHGSLIEKKPPFLMLDVNGVGYECQASMTTFYKLPDTNKTVTLYIHHAVRDDGHYLYAFAEQTERQLFRTLIKVNGVGPKVALAILSGIEPNSFVNCIMDNDLASLQRVPGIGKKTASRLMIEMRDRLADWQPGLSMSVSSDTNNSTSPNSMNSPSQEAISALIALGYKAQSATRAIRNIEQPGLSCEELIRIALKGMTEASSA